MKATKWMVPVAFALGAAASAWAADAVRPTDATGQCKDGTYTTAKTHSGACSDHGGVKSWFSEANKPTSTETSASTASKRSDNTVAAAGSDKVWVNTRSKVYHCAGDRWYGKTKHGEYMTEAEAKAKGNHADHGKACTA